MNKPIIIIGSGLSGYVLATEFRKLDQTTPLLIITDSDGRFYSKPLLSTALTHQKTDQTLANDTPEGMAEKLSAEIRTHAQVTRVDAQAHCVWVGDERLDYRQLVLACGADPVHLKIDGDGAEDIVSVNSLADYAQFRERIAGKKRVLIIGAGLVGCEFANDLCNGGYQVDVVSLGGHPVERLLPEEAAQGLKTSLAEVGVQWHFGAQVLEVVRSDESYQVTLSDGEQVSADAVLSAVGLRPSVALAESAGLQVDHGIVVDRYLQSSDADIYALGDCAGVNGILMFYIAPLRRCASALAKTLAGEKTAVSYPAMPVLMKTPACPTVVCPPPEGLAGAWVCEGEGSDRRALFYDQAKALRGFALSGKCVMERPKLTQALPDIF